MTRTYFQRDGGADDGRQSACSGLSLAGSYFDREMNETGPVGSGTGTIGANNADTERAVHLESASGEPNEATWPAGDVVVRINVTTANSNVDFKEIYVCQVSSTGSNKATWGSLTGLSEAATSGVHTFTVSCSEITGALTSDQIYILVGITRTSGHGTQQATITMDQEIDTPFDGVVAAGERGILRGTLRGAARGV